jgi:hypothetical protein
MGVPHNATARGIAVPCPRSAGSVDRAPKRFFDVVKVWTDTPMMTRARPTSQSVGMIAASAKPHPKDCGTGEPQSEVGFRPAG